MFLKKVIVKKQGNARRQAIPDCHAAAKETGSQADIALCHAVGQACSVVHAAGYAIGFPIYELTAIVRRYGAADCAAPVEARTRQYMERLVYWWVHARTYQGKWADFFVGGR